MSFSVKINLRRPARRDGTCTIRLQIIIGGVVWFHNLDLSWPEALFDEKAGECLASLPPQRWPPDYHQALVAQSLLVGGPKELAKRAKDYNLLIGQALAKANEVQVRWRLSNEVLTLERFKRDFETAGDKSDFITYYRTKLTERFRSTGPRTRGNTSCATSMRSWKRVQGPHAGVRGQLPSHSAKLLAVAQR